MSNKVPQIRFKGFTDPWEQRKLGDLGKVFTGNTPKTSENENWTSDGTGHVWITPTDIQQLHTSNSDRHLSDIGWEKARVVPEKSVLITSIASIGKNTINTVPAAFNQQINAIVPEGADAEFILAVMEKESARFASLAGQTATAIINKTEFEKFKINAPSFDEQIRIGELFSKVDMLIAANQRKLDLLKKQKKGYLQKMFPKNGAKVPELRFAGFADDWEQRKFKNFISKSGPRNKNGEFTEAYSVSNTLGLVKQSDQFDGRRLDSLDKKDYKIVQPYEFAYNPARINVGSIAFNNLNKPVIVSSLYVIVKMSDNLNDQFVLQWLKSPEFNFEVIRNTEGSVRKYLFYENFANVRFPYTPNYDEQVKIGALLGKLDNIIALHQRKLEKLQELKKGCLQKMFC